MSDGHIAIDPDKIKAVTDWPVLFKNLHEVQSFLRLVGYYRKFIPHFSYTVRYLYDLTRKNVKFKWTDKHTKAVDHLKKAVTSPDCLAIFDSVLPTVLMTDTYDYALRAVLMQKYPHSERLIAFISCTLNSSEHNSSMWEKELFTIV